MKEGKTLYRNIRQLRIAIMHSTKKLHDLRELVSVYAPKTGETLFRAICYASGFEKWEIMAHSAILREFPMRGEVQILLIGGEPSSLGPNGKDPHFELSHELKDLKLTEDGSVTYTVATSLKACINPNVQFRPRETRLYGDSEIKGAILSKTVRTAGGEETSI